MHNVSLDLISFPQFQLLPYINAFFPNFSTLTESGHIEQNQQQGRQVNLGYHVRKENKVVIGFFLTFIFLINSATFLAIPDPLSHLGLLLRVTP